MSDTSYTGDSSDTSDTTDSWREDTGATLEDRTGLGEPNVDPTTVEPARQRQEAVHRDHQVLLQEAIVEVTQGAQGQSLSDVMEQLDAALAARGLPSQPDRWREAVAREAVNGNVYIESAPAADAIGIGKVLDQDESQGSEGERSQE